MDNDLEGSIALSKEADISKGTFKKVRHSDLGPFRGAQGATKVAQKSAQRGPESSPERVGRDKIDAKAVAEAEKVDFVESAPRSSPLERQRLGPPQINPRLTPLTAKNRVQAAPDALEIA